MILASGEVIVSVLAREGLGVLVHSVELTLTTGQLSNWLLQPFLSQDGIVDCMNFVYLA